MVVYTYATSGATPVYMWAVLALAAIVIMICAFSQRMRQENGSLNTERIVFSLFGGVLNIFVAYLSLVVDVPTGSSAHTLYNGGGIPVIFVIFGLLCFTNFVYSIMAPEVLEVDKKEMGQKEKPEEKKEEKKDEE